MNAYGWRRGVWLLALLPAWIQAGEGPLRFSDPWIRAVPPGRVCSYGGIARRAGLPRRARMVARLLAQNDDPELPWHRIVRADGRIAFAAGSRAFRQQCARLKREGVVVVDGRVRLHG